MTKNERLIITARAEKISKRKYPNKGNNFLIHGMSKTPEHIAWLLMKARCHNKNHPRYKNWGGRGISVCEEWRKSFMVFFLHVGKRPTPNHSMDRINNNKGYEPGNVRWATKIQQSSNRPGFVRRIIYRGKIFNLSELSRKFQIDRECLKYRLDNGWDVERAIKKNARA